VPVRKVASLDRKVIGCSSVRFGVLVCKVGGLPVRKVTSLDRKVTGIRTQSYVTY
jgi:hypothetical protein